VQSCIWPSGCHCHSLSLASVESKLVLPFWYRLTWVVPEKGPLNVCVCVCVSSCRVSLADGCSPLSIARKSAVKTVTVDLLCCCCLVPVHFHFSSLNSMTNTIIFHACFMCDVRYLNVQMWVNVAFGGYVG